MKLNREAKENSIFLGVRKSVSEESPVSVLLRGQVQRRPESCLLDLVTRKPFMICGKAT